MGLGLRLRLGLGLGLGLGLELWLGLGLGFVPLLLRHAAGDDDGDVLPCVLALGVRPQV